MPWNRFTKTAATAAIGRLATRGRDRCRNVHRQQPVSPALSVAVADGGLPVGRCRQLALHHGAHGAAVVQSHCPYQLIRVFLTQRPGPAGNGGIDHVLVAQGV